MLVCERDGSGTPKPITLDGYRSLVALMDDVARREPPAKPRQPAIPPRETAKGIAFVEFASRGKEAEELGKLFQALGFAKVARHRNKAVDLYRQGDIRFIVNQETEGHAGRTWTVRGISVCDIGLNVGSASETSRRAAALGDEPFEQPIGDGEIAIPAIRGLSGSVLHFIDPSTEDVWDREFVSLDERAEGAGLTSVDHLAQTMSYGDMLSWTLFYTTLFEMRKSPMVDVIDPDGVVRSQVVESPDHKLRVTLNGAETHRTLAGSFLAETFGSQVQHIALATDDIFATAEHLAKLGFEVLPIPGNYYRDLAARFSLFAFARATGSDGGGKHPP
ncbi:VOC family protein [Fulvimarina sp. MAC8]|uniref:4-hydroxyphenylpyruvate dioxygenase family protein n=1 Tax=Fulvimarina sp. MAC8 TaxID=3162874 RepID=UPI0032EFD6FF